MPKLTVADLEVLFTANTLQVQKADKQILAIGKKIESNPIEIDADAKGALGSMDRVEQEAKKLVSERAVVKLDADISRAEANLGRAVDKLEDLHIRAEGGLDVTADVKRAEASIQRIERQLDGLRSARNKVDVEVDEEPAEAGLKRFLSLFRKKTEEAGDEGGRSLSQGLDAATRGAGQKVGDVVGGDIESTLVDALAAIPIAGGIVLAGVAIGKAITGAIQDGLNQEKGRDRLQGLTGISEADALRISRAAGEAYANNFGESVESNMNASRLALQFRILDPTATTRDAQLVVQGLTGIADVLEEDVRPTAQAVAQLLGTGMVKSAQEAYDLIAAGARNGLNRNEDLLDTLTEYPSLFARLGLSGDEALGLINQGMKAGARNSDLAADALKEFQIRATDASESSAEGFKALGLNAEDMTARIARGGQEARDGLAEVLTKLRETEDPVVRNAAAVALFGTQAEDLGEALFAMDLSSAVEQLGGVTGAAQKMFDTLNDNDASKIEQAQRNIEVAADGIKGALAAAFSEPLGDFAEWVSQNRGPVLQFFSDLINGAFDFGVSATESFGAFVSGPLADMVDGLKGVIKFINPFADTSDLETFINDMRDFESTTDGTVQTLEDMRDQFNGFADGQIALGYVNDAALKTADSVSKVGLAVDGSRIAIGGLDLSNIKATESGRALQEQLDAAAQSLLDEYDAAIAAGESQENLQARYAATRDALMGQLTAMGLTQEQAQSLIDTVLQTPETAVTTYTSNAEAEKGKVIDLGNRIITLPDGDTTITADTKPAATALENLIITNNGKTITLRVLADGTGFKLPGGQLVTAPQARGHIVEFMANGGLPGLQPMASLAQMVPPSTWRVVGDRSDVPELFAPLDGSARSWALILEGLRRMPGRPPEFMAEGDITRGPVRTRDARSVTVNQRIYTSATDGRLIARSAGREIEQALGAS
ncbi:MAG: phage tail tape measure protein [Microbacterium sp.]